MVIATLPPNTLKGSHAHKGPEVGYVLEGELTLLIPGQPAKIIKAGESFQYQAGVLHDTKAGPRGAKVLATWVVEKGKQNS
jgi:quercetin dioxygenase-like cupin family protein